LIEGFSQMPIDTKHPRYADNINQWIRCRDVYNGDDAVKERGQVYLPKIDANQSDQEYRSYASRATFFEAVGRSVDGFIGAISRRTHKISLPTNSQRMVDDATLSGIALSEFVKRLCQETLLTSRGGILVDYDEAARRSYLSFYQAEAIINWSATRVVLAETVYEEDAADPYKLAAVDQLRELSLIDGAYDVTLWRKPKADTFNNEWQRYGDVIQPNKRGVAFDKLPFFWLSILGHTSDICKPPLLGMVNLALSHYRLSADYAHGLHWTGLPTFYVAGATDDNPVHIGAATALLLKDANAKVGYAEFKGDGLGSLERAIAATENRMAVLGAAILGAEARRVETAEAARIRHSGETGLLMAAVSAVQATLQTALQFAADWDGAAGKVSVELNDDFISARLDPQTLLGLVQAYQAGALTLGSLLQAMQDGDLLPQKTVITDEVAHLEARGPIVQS
jgi:hypothetical protein